MSDHARGRAGVPEGLDVDAVLVMNLEGTDPDDPSMRCRTPAWKPAGSTIGRRARLSVVRGEA